MNGFMLSADSVKRDDDYRIRVVFIRLPLTDSNSSKNWIKVKLKSFNH